MLADTLKTTLADAFVLYFKAHSYHWNVEGSDFQEYHSFLGKLYEGIFESIDHIAELIRTLDVYAPTSLNRIKELSSIEESADIIPDARTMLLNLKSDNDKYLATLYRAYNEAEQASEFGVSNSIQGMITEAEKNAWMLRSFTK